jgi:serine/threonine protein kinase
MRTGAGEVPADTLFEHAATCLTCGQALEGIDREIASLTPVVQHCAVEDPYQAEPECRQAIELLERLGVEPNGVFASTPLAEVPQQVREYQLLEKLGAGGMGEVFKAFHTQLERIVALKTLPPTRLNTPQAVSRFRREIRAAGSLDHPCIVRATDAGDVDGVHFLVMDYVEGLNLSQLVHRFGPLSVADSCELIRQAASGLEHAHVQGLVHRDIKPSNLMLSVSGQLKILDFGLARWQMDALADDGLTASGQIMGTLEYMAPEQFDDPHRVDSRADIYSLGCVLFFVLTGQPPFPRASYDSTYRLMAAHAAQPLPSVLKFRPDLPMPIVRLVERMLAKAAADRYPTCGEVVEAARPWTDGAGLRGAIRRAWQPRSPGASQPAWPDSPPTPCGLGSGDTQNATQGRPIQASAAGAQEPRTTTLVALAAAASPPALGKTRRRYAVRAAISLSAVAIGCMLGAVWYRAWRHESASAASSAGLVATLPADLNGSPDTFPHVHLPSESAESPVDMERQVALWALDRGAVITVHPGREIKPGQPLPAAVKLDGIKLYSGMSDRDVARLSGLSQLRSLDLRKNPLTDRSIQLLANHRSLRWLYLGQTKISDQGLSRLSALSKLESLGLEETKITDVGFCQIQGLRALRELRLGMTSIHDESLEHLKQFPSLVRLDLYRTAITNAGLKHLTALPNLAYLNLQDNGIDDHGLSDLAELKQLKELNVKQTRASDAGVETLRAALPDCRIEY